MLPLLDRQLTTTTATPVAATLVPRDVRPAWSPVLYGRTVPGLVLAASRFATAECHRRDATLSPDALLGKPEKVTR